MLSLNETRIEDIRRFFGAIRADDPALMAKIAERWPGVINQRNDIPLLIDRVPATVPSLVCAAAAQSMGALEWLVKKGADLEDVCDFSKKTALFHAVEKGNVEAVKILLDAGADPFTKVQLTHVDDDVLAAAEEKPEIAAMIVAARMAWSAKKDPAVQPQTAEETTPPPRIRPKVPDHFHLGRRKNTPKI